MFEPRRDDDGPPSDEESRRQRVVLDVVLGRTRNPITLIEKLAAVYARHASVNPVARYLIGKRLDEARALVAEAGGLYYEPSLRAALRRLIADTIVPGYGDVIFLPLRPRILAVRPRRAERYNLDLRVRPSTASSLREFEDLAFPGARVRFRYYSDTSFAAYVYQNILYALNARSVDELLDNVDWRARLAVLLHETRLSDAVARGAFERDRVAYGGRYYDTSYVPKYDVSELRPMLRLDGPDVAVDADAIKSWRDFDPTRATSISKVPSVFLFFPFKSGYYVQPGGAVIYLDVPLPRSRLALSLFRRVLCTEGELEGAIGDAARSLTLEDAIALAVNVDEIEDAGVALMILRRMTGDYVRVKSYDVALLSELETLAWMRLPCRERASSNGDNVFTLVLPVNNAATETALASVALVRDVARSCVSAIGACVACSAYCILELDMYPTYAALTNDAEKYVFYTIVMQYHPSHLMLAARNKLRPVFGREPIDLTAKYRPNARRWYDSTLADRLRDETVELIRPSEINEATSVCASETCIDAYRFVDERLRDLVATTEDRLNADDAIDDDDECAAFLAVLAS